MDDQLFRNLLKIKAQEYRDTAGRPLGEQRVFHLHRNLETEYKVCQFSGSRYKHERPMNISALKNIVENWNDLVSLLRRIDFYYRKYIKKDSLDYLDLSQKAMIAFMLPSYLAFKKTSALGDGSIPVVVSSCYKVAGGMVFVGREMYIKNLFNIARLDYSPEALYDYADQSQSFIGDTEVCAASKKLVMEIAESLIQSGEPADLPERSLDFIDDFEHYFRFAIKVSRLFIVYLSFIMQTRRFTLIGNDTTSLSLNGMRLKALHEANNRRQDFLQGTIAGLLNNFSLAQISAMHESALERLGTIDPEGRATRQAEPIDPLLEGSQANLTEQEQVANYIEWEERQTANINNVFRDAAQSLGWQCENMSISYEDIKMVSGPTARELSSESLGQPRGDAASG